METIYIDRLFLINLIIDYLLVLGSARVGGVMLRRRRYILSAAFGAAYAALSVLPGLSALSLAPLKIVSGILMALIAFGGEEKFWRCCTVFFAVSAFFGGAVWALSLQSGLASGGLMYVPLSMPVLVLSFALCYAVLSVVFRRTAKNAGKHINDAAISLGGAQVALRVLYDSGSALCDPISGASVLVTSAEKLAPLFPGREAALKGGATELITALPEYGTRFRLIPYRALGTQNGMLAAFRPDELTLGGAPRDDILVAISPHPVSGEGFDAVCDA